MLDKLYRDRLMVLVRFLLELPANRFNFRRWVGNDWKGKPDLSCGTTACAFGWATAIPEFQDLGLMLFQPQPGWVYVTLESIAGTRSMIGEMYLAAETVFGLPARDFDYLFTPASDYTEYELEMFERDYGHQLLSNDATAKEVAERIREFVESHTETA